MCIYPPWKYKNWYFKVRFNIILIHKYIIFIFYFIRHIYNDAGAVETLFYKFFGLFLESPEKGSDSTLFCCL